MKYKVDNTGLTIVRFWWPTIVSFCKADEADEDDYYYDVWDEEDYSDNYDDQQNKRPVTRIDYKK